MRLYRVADLQVRSLRDTQESPELAAAPIAACALWLRRSQRCDAA
jgi:hypothetical protein